MMWKLLPIARDVLWLASPIAMLLGKDVLSFSLGAFLGAVHLLIASGKAGDEEKDVDSGIDWDTILGVLLIVCSVIPLATMAYR